MKCTHLQNSAPISVTTGTCLDVSFNMARTVGSSSPPSDIGTRNGRAPSAMVDYRHLRVTRTSCPFNSLIWRLEGA